jgi:hypothetical protein
MSILKAFTQQLDNLVSNLCKLFPTDADLAVTKTSISFLIKTNPRKLQQIFNKHISIYSTQILGKNEKFFQNTNFVELESKNIDNIAYANKIMSNLKKYWNIIDKESKNNIWKYLQVLIILNNKCINSK